MKHFKFSHLFLLGICPLIFSCEHKSDMETQKASDTSAITNPVKDDNTKNENVTSWAIDPQSSKVSFTIKNMGMTVDGTLDGLKGLVLFDPQDLKDSKFETAVEVNTINTGIQKRDKDLMDEKFFNEQNFKQITFRSDSIIKSGNGYEVSGNFTIKGISQHRKIPFTFEQNGDDGVFKSNFTINRLDFGVGGDGPAMGTDVNVSLIVMAKKK
jgi:polyisoprenoid-binding protein YceI